MGTGTLVWGTDSHWNWAYSHRDSFTGTFTGHGNRYHLTSGPHCTLVSHRLALARAARQRPPHYRHPLRHTMPGHFSALPTECAYWWKWEHGCQRFDKATRGPCTFYWCWKPSAVGNRWLIETAAEDSRFVLAETMLPLPRLTNPPTRIHNTVSVTISSSRRYLAALLSDLSRLGHPADPGTRC